MKNSLAIIFTLVMLFFGKLSFAQHITTPVTPLTKYYPADTLYYLFDKTLATDSTKVIKANNEVFETFFKINCNCLFLDDKRYEDKNILLQALTKNNVIISKERFKSIKIVTLGELIDFIKSHNGVYFGKNAFGKEYVMYIAEPIKNGYVLYNVRNTSWENVTVE